MIALKITTGYLSVSTGADGVRRWCVVCHNRPLCANNVSLCKVLAVAQDLFGRVTLAVWDGDKGEFVSEMATDPTL